MKKHEGIKFLECGVCKDIYAEVDGTRIRLAEWMRVRGKILVSPDKNRCPKHD